MMAGQSIQRLDTASSFMEDDNTHLIKVCYRTGAKFEGHVVDHKRTGHGTFIWPNGCKYEGDFLDHLRHGRGTQVWFDGSSYSGDFISDLRHGSGAIKWINGEVYEGSFFKDRRHGSGVYTWPDGSSYTGTFYMDRKEGYGTFIFANGNMFQGLYKEDEREGPGVVTYMDGSQDVGIWHGEKLIKLCTAIDKAFSITAHPKFGYKPHEHVSYIDIQEDRQPFAHIETVINPPPALDYPPTCDLSQKVNELYSEALDPRSLAVDRRTFDEAFFKTIPNGHKNMPKVMAWNATPVILSIQKHTLKHAAGKSAIDLDIESVIKLNRSVFKPKGPSELQSEELIVASGLGDTAKVEALLNSGKVHPDVSDRNGHTSLIGATVNWHMDVINVLLNQGADVNKLSDEGCSALSSGLIFYYPVEGFLYNIAERYMKSPPELMNSESKPNGQPKGILLSNNNERRASRLNQINRIMAESNFIGVKPVSLSDKRFSVTKLSGEMVKILTTEPLGELMDRDEDRLNEEDADSAYGGELVCKGEVVVQDVDEIQGSEEFESNLTMQNYHIEVTDQLVERCATQLSHNELVVSRQVSELDEMSKARRLAIQMSHHERMKDTLDLLLRRGADPNSSSVPMPVLFFAIKSADVEMVKQLLMKGANTNTRLSTEKGGLYPIHIACAIPGEEGVEITELLLNALANPDSRAELDDAFLNLTLSEEWSKDAISEESQCLLGGRTALQITCARDDNYKHACKVVRLLLEHKANSNFLCNGFSPLTLAITSGNDMAIDELLLFGTDVSLPLTHGVGNALCVATSTEYEHRRTIQCQTQLVDKLIRAGANVLAPIPVGPKRVSGTAVDYAYYMFNQDRRIAHMPYHALTHAERDTYNARRKLLAHIGDIMRNKAVEREKRRNIDEKKVGMRSRSPSANFLYIGAGAKMPHGLKPKSAGKSDQVKFEAKKREEKETKLALNSSRAPSPTRKPLFKYCYECGRSVGVRLAVCTRCKEVYYCSKACKLKAWNARHREECIRIGGRSRSPSPKNRARSPSAATNADNLRKHTVKINNNETEGYKQISVSSRKVDDFDSQINGKLGHSFQRHGQASGRKQSYTSQSYLTKTGQNHVMNSHAVNFSSKDKIKSGYKRSETRLRSSVKNNGNHPSGYRTGGNELDTYRENLKKTGGNLASLPSLDRTKKWLLTSVPVKGLSRSAHGERKLAKHKFRTGSPPNFQYVYIDNYSHN